MKKVSLSGSPRESVGKKDAVLARREGKVPAVLYGGETQTLLNLDYNEIEKLIFTPDVFEVQLDINGEKRSAIIQDVQLHPVTDKIIHVDFLELIEGKPVKVKLPVKLSGMSRGVRNGGRLAQIYRKLTVVGEKKDLPEAIELNIERLKIGQDIRVKEVSFPGIKLLEPPNAVIVAVKAARGAIEDEQEDEDTLEGEEAAEAGEGGDAKAENAEAEAPKAE